MLFLALADHVSCTPLFGCNVICSPQPCTFNVYTLYLCIRAFCLTLTLRLSLIFDSSRALATVVNRNSVDASSSIAQSWLAFWVRSPALSHGAVSFQPSSRPVSAILPALLFIDSTFLRSQSFLDQSWRLLQPGMSSITRLCSEDNSYSTFETFTRNMVFPRRHHLDWSNSSGPIIRITPDELHVDDPDYYDELYTKGGRKDKYERMARRFGSAQSTFNTSDHEHHNLRRAPLNPMFSRRRNREAVQMEQRLERIHGRCHYWVLLWVLLQSLEESRLWGIFS